MQRNLSGNYLIDQVDSTHKDTVIASLKKELFQLKDLQHDFLRLNDEVATIESKYAILLNQKQKTQNDHKIKIEINKKSITDMRTNVDDLRMQIHRMTSQVDESVRQNFTLKRMCDNRQSEIASLMTSNIEIEKNNNLHQEQNTTLSLTLKQLKEERIKQQDQCERLNKILDDSISTLKSLQKECKQLQSTNFKLETVMLQASRDHSALTDEMKSREQTLQKTNQKLEQLGLQNDDLKDQTARLQKQCDHAQQECQQLCSGLQSTMCKNKELSQKLKSLQNTLRSTEGELDQSVLKRQTFRQQHLQLSNQNKVLNSQLDKCLLSILEYEKINKDLQEQVENYIACDEQARKMLDRKDMMREMLEQVCGKLKKTQEHIAHLR